MKRWSSSPAMLVAGHIETKVLYSKIFFQHEICGLDTGWKIIQPYSTTT
ncbi:MAG: hypothetical protein IT313_13975 [Anaerolineales bacterium]|nr:hypothetical protein [Anaerolineales bacterium]